jgi:enediyne biosynthesis protein E4
VGTEGRAFQARQDGGPKRAAPQDRVRDQVGARLQIIRPGAPTLWRRSRADGSYASANDPRVLVGLGASTALPTIKVTWPSGHVETFANVALDRYTTLVEGSGSK